MTVQLHSIVCSILFQSEQEEKTMSHLSDMQQIVFKEEQSHIVQPQQHSIKIAICFSVSAGRLFDKVTNAHDSLMIKQQQRHSF